MSVDPGITGTGISLWSDSLWEKKVAPIRVLNIMPRRYSNWTGKASSVTEQFNKLLAEVKPVEVYCEWPAYFDDAKGRMAAKEEGLTKLTFCVGNFSAICQLRGIPFILVPVRVWKGQLPKEIIEKRIIERIPEVLELNPRTHMWDSIGIGLFVKGHFRL